MTTSRSILVVDDNGINRLLPGLILRPFGWRVYEAENGLDALTQLRNYTHHVSCVLLDIAMPDISGLDVLSDLRKDNEFMNCKIVAYTAYATAEDVSHLKSIGFDAVLIKPITSKALLEILQTY
jgi:CheY-like chemotaxis protein